MRLCGVCKKCLDALPDEVDDRGQAASQAAPFVSGLTIRVGPDGPAKYLQRQLGGYESGRDYMLCLECMLRTFRFLPRLPDAEPEVLDAEGT